MEPSLWLAVESCGQGFDWATCVKNLAETNENSEGMQSRQKILRKVEQFLSGVSEIESRVVSEVESRVVSEVEGGVYKRLVEPTVPLTVAPAVHGNSNCVEGNTTAGCKATKAQKEEL